MSARKSQRNGTAWEPSQSLAGPHRGATEEQIESLKEQLLAPLLATVKNAELLHELRWVANEAAGLAWCTVCPTLILPSLLEEKISVALQRWDRQQLLWKRQALSDAIKQEPASVLPYLKPAARAA